MIQSCGGGGGGTGGTLSSSGGSQPTPLAVDFSSFVNKSAADFSDSLVPDLSQVTTDGYQSFPDTLAVADFFQSGQNSAFVVGFKLGAIPYARAYFLKYDSTQRKWVDDSVSLFSNESDRVVCDDPRQSLVTKFNSDGRPDVYVVCAGGGVTGVPQQMYITSGTGGKYVRHTTTFTADASSASVANLDADQHVDVVTNHRGVVYRIFGTGGFGALNWYSQKDVIATDAGKEFSSSTNSIFLIPRDGQTYLLTGGYGSSQNVIIWYKTDQGYVIANSYRHILISTNVPEYKYDYFESGANGYLYAVRNDVAPVVFAKIFRIAVPYYDSTTIASANLYTYAGTPTYANPPSWVSRIVIKNGKMTPYDAGCLNNPVQLGDQRCGQTYTVDPGSFN